MNLQFFLIIVLAASSIDVAWSMCQKSAEIDSTYGMETAYFGYRQVTIASDQDKLKVHCSTYEDGFKGIEDYSNKCLKNMAQSIALTFVKSFKLHFDKRCKDPDFSAEFIEHNQCFKDAEKLKGFHQCSDHWFHMMDQIKNIPGIDPIQASCCIFHQYQQCIEDKNGNLCHDRNVKFWNAALDDVSDDTVQMFCGGLNNLADCNNRFPKDKWEAITGPVFAMDDATLEKRNKWQSPFFVLVDVLSNHEL